MKKINKMYKVWSKTVLGQAGANFPEWGGARYVYMVALEGKNVLLSDKTVWKNMTQLPRHIIQQYQGAEGLETLTQNMHNLYAICVSDAILRYTYDNLHDIVQQWPLPDAERAEMQKQYNRGTDNRDGMIEYIAYVLWMIISP